MYIKIFSVRNPENGIVLDIFSDQNGLMFYTGDYLDATLPSSGVYYGTHSGLCFESHNYPDSVNKVSYCFFFFNFLIL